MKTLRLFASVLLGLSVLSACTVKQQASERGPSATQWKSGVRGTWVLQSIDKENFPNDHSVKTIFEEAPPECFVGSVWNLPSNGSGNIRFEATGRLCAPGAVRNIHWSIFNPGTQGGEPQFQFKKIYPGDQAKNVTSGYRMELSYADENSLVMRMPLNVGGKQGFLVFNFEKYQ